MVILLLTNLPDQRTQILDQEHQVQGIYRRRLEIEMQVETPGIFVDGVHEQGADADGVGGLRRSHQGIEQ